MGVRISLLARRLPHWLWLGLLVVLVAALNVYWRLQETRPPHWDMAYHLANSLFYRHAVSLGDPISFLGTYRFYPPLAYWVTDLFYGVLGNEAMWVAVLSNVVWLAVLVFATFAVGRRLWSARVGWLSVVFVVTAPMIVSSSKEYMLDLPLTAVAALSLYLLIRADGFASRRFSLVLGAVVGCGLLVKWTLPLILLFPLVHALAGALSEVRARRDFRRFVNAGFAAALALAIAGPWYIHNFSKVAGSALAYNGPEGEALGNPRVATPASALWYFWNLFDQQLYLVPVLMLLVGIGFCFRNSELARRNLYPILMVVGTYVMFTVLRHKDPRYTLPMLPGLAVIATSWIQYVSSRVRNWITVGFVAYAGAALFAVSFGTSLLPASIVLDMPATSFSPSAVTLFAQHGYIIGPPTHESWHQEEAFRIMSRAPVSERTFSYRGAGTIWFNAHGLRYYASRYDATRAGATQARFLLERGDGLVTPTGFSPIRRWRLPDGGALALYQRLS